MTRQARILLLGAGHANLLALPALRRVLPDAQISLIDPGTRATYSGMFPGLIAGHYDAEDLGVDLAGLAWRHCTRLISGRVTGIDPLRHRVCLSADRGEELLDFDVASLDIGSHSAMTDIQGFDAHAVAVKPLDEFAARFTAFLDGSPGDAPLAVIGGGIAGAEIALALADRLNGRVTLIEAGPEIAPSLSKRARQRLTVALRQAGVCTVTNDPVTRIEDDAVILHSGRLIGSELTIGAAGARAHGWLARGLPTDGAGFVRVTPTLQVEGFPDLFAVGDCASMTHAPRPKAGVFAVRQAPFLARNLVARLRGSTLTEYHPQRDHLKIISLGGRSALADWYGLTLHGKWLWKWKDRIDRAFMRRLTD